MSEKRLDSLLSNADSPLGELARQAARAGSLTELVSGCLPDEYAAHVRSAALSKQCELTITTESPAWAAKLRFESPQLLIALKERDLKVEKIQVKVRPHE